MPAPREPQTMAVVPEWIENHCVVPDGFRAGEPFRMYDLQLLYIGNFYLVRGDAVWVPDNPILAPSFVHRRAIWVGPQKIGKNPLGAAHICVEAEGPVVFAGFAGKGDGYACADHGCGCGWEYAYDPGEPMGMQWPSPLIQVVAYSEDQTDNTWDVLRPMISKGPLADLMPSRGESVIRLRGSESGDDPPRIETVTSSSLSRLGARTTFVLQDQLEGWTVANGMDKVADAQYRNLGGVGGRASLLANAWDPSQQSIAQREFESRSTDIYRLSVWKPAELDFADIVQRRQILEAVYPIDTRREGGGHVDLDSVGAEAAHIAEYDLPQARRWYGNEIVEGQGKAFDMLLWRQRAVKRAKVVPEGALITLGMDGSVRWDHFPLIATEVASGYQWPLHIWIPGGPGREVPMDAVEVVLEAAFDKWDVWRMYADPPYIQSWLARWKGRWPERIVERETSAVRRTAVATREWKVAQTSGEMSHCAETDAWCPLFTEHVGNAVRHDTGYRDDEGFLWYAEKERSGSPKKMDSVPAAVLSWEARNHAIAAGALNVEPELESAYESGVTSILA
jgi:hypothetical protein